MKVICRGCEKEKEHEGKGLCKLSSLIVISTINRYIYIYGCISNLIGDVLNDIY